MSVKGALVYRSVFSLLRRYIPVTAERAAAIAAELTRTRAMLAQMRALLRKARGSVVRWKTKADAAEQRASAAQKALAMREKEVQRHLRRIEQLQARIAQHDEKRAQMITKLRARLAEERDKRRLIAAELREQLDVTARELASARDGQMLIDVKLDILEGAANALDARTRRMRESSAERDVEGATTSPRLTHEEHPQRNDHRLD
jgi:chromosome segregation ATPase